MNIDDMVSPSDQRLIDLAGGLVDDLGITMDIFKDRNSNDVSTSFALGLVNTIILRICNISVDGADMVKFLASQAEKDGLD